MSRPKLNSSDARRRPRLDVSAYRGQWIAVDPKTYKVLGHGSSPEDATRAAAAGKATCPLLYFVPESDAYFVGSAR